MTFKVVTDGQLRSVRKMATDKGVDKQLFEEHGLKGGIMSTALNAVKFGKRIVIVVEPPEGGRIYRVTVPVILNRPWWEAVNAVGPNTPADYNVHKVGHLYLPTGTGTAESEMILMNLGPKGGGWKRAIEWSEEYGLKRTDPRRVFAIGEHKPEFYRELGMDPVYVVATQDCAFGGWRQACCVWWRGSGRGAYLCGVEGFGHAGDWFAFASD